jgi:hypothetical protein
VKSLYAANERTDVPGFFRSKYGTDECPPGHENIWRLALTKHIHESYHFFASNFAYVADKAGNMTTLRPFVGQAILRYTLDSQLRAELPGRVGEVKVRQLGWTVENIARGLHFALDENKRAMLLVDDEDVAVEQATRLGTMLNGLPGFMQPMRRIQNMKHLVFDNPNQKDRLSNPGLNAVYQITVPSSFRGAPPGFVCVSEYAHMDSDRQYEVQSGIISAMPLTANSILIIDTTPNGIDDSYFPMIMEAIEENPKWVKRIESWKGELAAADVLDGILGVPDAVAKGYPGVMVPAICPWRFHEEYTCRSRTNPRGELRPLSKAQRGETESSLGKIPKYGGEEEFELRDKYGVSTERLFWRRRKIDGYKLPSEELKLLTFRQEFFGCTIREAFIESGSAPFDRASLDALSRQVREPAAVGIFRAEGEFDHRDTNQWQQVRIYAPPQNGEKYTMGVDCDQAYESPDSDATVAQVVRFSDNKIVCTYEARVPSYKLLEQLFYIYRWYFNCYYAIETAGIGYDLVRRCVDKGMGNVHYYKRYDADVPEPTKFPGWETKAQTRPVMDQTFTELACARNRETFKPEPDIIIPDAKTINEIRGLSRTPTGAYKSNRGHDDHYDALCIALCIARDPYSGLHRQRVVEEEDKRKDFEWHFSQMMKLGQRDRNHPDLSSI